MWGIRGMCVWGGVGLGEGSRFFATESQRRGTEAFLRFEDDDFVVKEGEEGEVGVAGGEGERGGVVFVGDEEVVGFEDEIWGEFKGDLEGADGDELFEGGAPGGGAGEVEEVEDEAVGLRVEFAVEEAGAGDVEGEVVFGGPADDVGEEVAVVGEVEVGVEAVEVGGEVGDAARICFVDDEGGDGGGGGAHVGEFGRGGGEFGDEGEEDFCVGGDGERLEGAAEGEDVGGVEAGEDGVAMAGGGGFGAVFGAVGVGAEFGGEAEVGVAGGGGAGADAGVGARKSWRLVTGDAEEVGEGAVGARVAVFVVLGGLSGGDERTAVGDEFSDGGELGVGDGAEVGEDENGEIFGFAFDVVEVDGDEGNAGADHGLGEALGGLIAEFSGAVSSEEVIVAL